MNIESNWKSIRRIFKQAFRSSLHYAMATVTPEGLPHVTPIGSLLLREPGHAIYFEEFTLNMPHNLENNKNVCVLAVRSGLLFWLSALIRGGFNSPPGIRLHGTVGPPRPATDGEIALWQHRVRRLRGTRGYETMWANMGTVRDVKFTSADSIHMAEMTRAAGACFDTKNIQLKGTA
ncbi:MAG: pyridoxamine 5'-phosphate oxidase family protein [Deltaproteobacteria bacterium]|nr:pyridoxamine 5'-phosphate oxidase family protein [Deltaproteobacteria bacterium]